MSDTRISAGSLIKSAFGLGLGRMGDVIRVGWFPLVAGLIGIMAYSYFTTQDVMMAQFEMYRNMASGSDMQETMATYVETAAAAQTGMYWVHSLVGLLLMFVVIAIPVVAYTRMVVDGATPRGPLYFRLGPKEIMVALDYILLLLLTYLVMLVVMIIPIIVAVAVFAGAESPEAFMSESPGIVILGGLGAFVFILSAICWFWAKFGLAIPIAVKEGGLGLRRAWRLSKGNTGALFFGIVGTYVLMFLMMIGFFIAILIVGGIVGIPLAMLATNTGMTGIAIAVGVALYIVVYVVMYCITTSIQAGLFAEAYRRIKGSSAVAAEFE